MAQQRHTGLGGTGGKAPSLSGEHGGSALGRHAVHVLVRCQAGAECALLPTQMGRQRPQQQAAVNGRITVDGVDSCRHHIGGGIRGQGAQLRGHTAKRSALYGAAYVRTVGLVIAAAQEDQTGLDTL